VLNADTIDYCDLLEQFRTLRKMGPIQNLIKMIPGMDRLIPPDSLEKLNDRHLTRIESMILSMTPEERRLEVDFVATRRHRIARGSGATVDEVVALEGQMATMRRNMRRPLDG